MRDWIDIVALVIALGVSFLLSGMEAGVFALSRFRVRRLARQGDARAERLQRYLESPESFLWTILVGNSLAALVVLTLCTLRLERWLGTRPGAFMAGIVLVLLLLYFFADLLPKVLFRRYPNRLSLIGVGPFRVVRAVLAPVVGLTERVSRLLLRWTGGQSFTGRLFGSRAELRQVIEESGPTLSREKLVMINRILDLENLRVRDVMTPMEKAATLRLGDRVADLVALVRERQVSYVPLWGDPAPSERRGRDGRGRRVLGVVALAPILFEEKLESARSLADFVQPALYVEETTRLEDALRTMQRGRQRLAVVLGPSGKETGVVTMNDILRAMFGEVRV